MSEDTATNQRFRKYDQFGLWIVQRVQTLAKGGCSPSGATMQGYLGGGAEASAALARLRHNVARPVGIDPGILDWTLKDIPDDTQPYAKDEPTSTELAAHAALTLFAVHQQSLREHSMHECGISFGEAIGRLSVDNPNAAGIASRFFALQTARHPAEIIRHARGLIQLLRHPRIPFDYGLFAQDLVALQGPEQAANGVRLRWGRDYARASQHSRDNQKNDN